VIILGVETATMACSVGLASEDGFIAGVQLMRGKVHAEQIPAAVEFVLRHAGLVMTDLDGLAVSIGPGSFTGLRIGLGLAKGLALGLGLPMAAVPTMRGMVNQVPPWAERACVMITARRGEVYQGLFRNQDNEWIPEGEICIVPDEALGEDLPKDDRIFVGTAATSRRDLIRACVPSARFLPEVQNLPCGYQIAREGRQMLLADEATDPEQLVPLYLKRFQGVE